MSTKLGQITIGTALALAPMAGVTNAPFRRICRQQAQRALADCGIKSDATAPYGIYVCEMITARALVDKILSPLAC